MTGPVKWGLVARPETGRGLGVLSRHINEWMRPDRLLLIEGCASGAGHPSSDDFGDTDTWLLNVHKLNADAWAWFGQGLDAVLHLETTYEQSAFAVHREHGVRSTLWVMPEHGPWLADPALTRPDQFWLPTTWRADQWPAATVTPVPCPVRPTPRLRQRAHRILHVAGQYARQDRNGTKAFAQATHLLPADTEIVVTTQTPDMVPACAANTRIVAHPATLADWYDWADVVVLPRRYGGLCLPALEAMAAGCVLAMTDCSPQNTAWPNTPIGVEAVTRLAVVGGDLDLHHITPAAIAATLCRLIDDPVEVGRLSASSAAYAAEWNWQTAGPIIAAAL